MSFADRLRSHNAIYLRYLAGIAVIVVGIRVQAEEPAAKDYWHGTLKAGPMELRLIMELQAKPEGGMEGKLISVDQGNVAIPLDSVGLEGGLRFESKKIQAKYVGEPSADGSSQVGTFTQAGTEFPLTFTKGAAPVPDVLKAAWTGKIKVGDNEVEVQLRVLENGELTLTRFDDLTMGVMGLSAELVPFEGGLKFRVPAIQGSFEGTWDDAEEVVTGTWKQGGSSLPLILTKKSAASKPAEVKHPQEPKAPFPYGIEEAGFPSLDPSVKLAGTLTIPEGQGPFPAVVLVSGSGPQNRDEALMGHRPFWVLADHLSRKGIAVLRYDDRGTAESTGDFSAATTEDFAKDAQGALAFLRQDPRIDGERLGIVGHSEGGLIATMLAASPEKLAHVVLMAGPGVPGDIVLETQSRAIARASGITNEKDLDFVGMKALMQAIKANAPQEEIDRLIKQAAKEATESAQAEEEAEASKKEDEKDDESVPMLAATYKMFSTPWFRYFLSYDPRVDLRKARCAVLAVIGEKDLQVLVDDNLPEIEKALGESPAPETRCVRMPGLNHLFQPAKSGSPQEYRVIEQTLAPEFLTLVEEWVLSH